MRFGILLLLWTLATLGLAADGAGQAGRLLSRGELKACMLRQDDLEARREALAQASARHAAELARIGRLALELSEVLRDLDTSDAAAVDAYNQRNRDRNVQVEALNQQALELNRQQADLQADAADHMASCVSRPYRLQDRDAVLRELGRKPPETDERRPKGKDGKDGKPLKIRPAPAIPI